MEAPAAAAAGAFDSCDSHHSHYSVIHHHHHQPHHQLPRISCFYRTPKKQKTHFDPAIKL